MSFDPTDPIWDDLFLGCALAAYVAEARAARGVPDPEATRRRAYRLYEEQLARDRAGGDATGRQVTCAQTPRHARATRPRRGAP